MDKSLSIDDVVSVDTETTGWDLSTGNVRIVQVSALRAKGARIAPFEAYFRQDDSVLDAMPPDAIGITGIFPEVVKAEGYPPSELFLEFLAEVSSAKVIASHNWKFDREVLSQEAFHLGIGKTLIDGMPFIDTLRLVREAYDDGWDGYGGSKLPDFKLATCYHGIVPKTEWTSLAGSGAHTALYDAGMVMGIIEHFLRSGLTVADMVEISSTLFVPRVCPIGKDRGQKGLPWGDVDPGFLKWMATNKVWKEDVGLEMAVLTEMERRGMISC